MNTTVFCTFEQQDLADLAVGRLHESDLGIRSIHYIGAHSSHHEQKSLGVMHSVSVFSGTAYQDPAPSRPVTLKIVCPEIKSEALVSKLINLRGYEIIKTR